MRTLKVIRNGSEVSEREWAVGSDEPNPKKPARKQPRRNNGQYAGRRKKPPESFAQSLMETPRRILKTIRTTAVLLGWLFFAAACGAAITSYYTAHAEDRAREQVRHDTLLNSKVLFPPPSAAEKPKLRPHRTHRHKKHV